MPYRLLGVTLLQTFNKVKDSHALVQPLVNAHVGAGMKARTAFWRNTTAMHVLLAALG